MAISVDEISECKKLIFGLLPFRTNDPTQPIKKKSRPNPIPTQLNPWVDPTHGQLRCDPSEFGDHLTHYSTHFHVWTALYVLSLLFLPCRASQRYSVVDSRLSIGFVWRIVSFQWWIFDNPRRWFILPVCSGTQQYYPVLSTFISVWKYGFLRHFDISNLKCAKCASYFVAISFY